MNLPLLIAASLGLLLSHPALAQPTPVDEVLCPVFIPEFPVKHCITITGHGCVQISITTFGVPGNPTVSQKVCPLS